MSVKIIAALNDNLKSLAQKKKLQEKITCYSLHQLTVAKYKFLYCYKRIFLQYLFPCKLNFSIENIQDYMQMENMEVLFHKQVSVHVPDEEEIGSIDEIELEYQYRKQFRRQKLATIKHHMEAKTQGRERKRQNKILYLINLATPILLSCLNAYNFIENNEQPELKGILITAFVFVGLFFSILSNLLLAPWYQILKLYFIFDSVVPVMIAAIIGFYAVLLFLDTGKWYQTAYAVDFPLWALYFAGSLRVNIAYANWSRWEVIAYKIVTMCCGLIFFYVGFTFMNGGYKITSGYLIQLQTRFRDMTYLYVFGVVQQFFECYRRLSYFDQTEELKYEYQFQAQAEKDDKRLANMQMNNVQQAILHEDIQDLLVTKIQSLKRVQSKKTSRQSEEGA